MTNFLRSGWRKMNPLEPSTGYLLKFMVFLIVVMVAGLSIGHLF